MKQLIHYNQVRIYHFGHELCNSSWALSVQSPRRQPTAKTRLSRSLFFGCPTPEAPIIFMEAQAHKAVLPSIPQNTSVQQGAAAHAFSSVRIHKSKWSSTPTRKAQSGRLSKSRLDNLSASQAQYHFRRKTRLTKDYDELICLPWSFFKRKVFQERFCMTANSKLGKTPPNFLFNVLSSSIIT